MGAAIGVLRVLMENTKTLVINEDLQKAGWPSDEWGEGRNLWNVTSYLNKVIKRIDGNFKIINRRGSYSLVEVDDEKNI